MTAIESALEGLNPTFRTAVVLRDIEDLSYDEIAEVLQVHLGTVKSRINRGRTELARQVRKLGGDGEGSGGLGDAHSRSGAYR